MRIPVSSLEVVGHRVGEPVDRAPAADVAADVAVVDVAYGGLPFKVRATHDAAVAERLRRQFAGRAHRRFAQILQGQPAGPLRTYGACAQDAKATESASGEALRQVHLALYNRSFGALKSDNKMRLGEAPPIFPRECYSEATSFGYSRVAAVAHSASVWRATAHNCTELAIAAQDVLAHRRPELPTSLVMLAGAHSLAVIGALDAETASRPMATWPPHLQVCDPWANLNCRACDYPRFFTEKMEQWAAGRKLIREGSDWHPANDKAWLDIVNQAPQVLARLTHRNGQFRNVLLQSSGSSQERDTGI
ncbi:hypothetical protein [Roseateles noduli]|uniref:hypothetical protein n=1 Tax=Roseateles noduli TaxID=2052484 RepID=UPI003D64CF04